MKEKEEELARDRAYKKEGPGWMKQVFVCVWLCEGGRGLDEAGLELKRCNTLR